MGLHLSETVKRSIMRPGDYVPLLDEQAQAPASAPGPADEFDVPSRGVQFSKDVQSTSSAQRRQLP